MGRETRAGSGSRAAGTAPAPQDAVARDRRWAADLRAAVFCSVAVCCLVLLIDTANGTLTAARGALWAGLAALLQGVLHPPLVSVGPGWLAVRGVWGTRRVCTDLLTSVRHSDGVTPRLVLRDALGGRVEVDPKVFADNPVLWHRLETGARRARASGLLRCGAGVVERLADRMDGDAARAVFEASDMD
ncbi:hypothetical protein ACFVTY_26630 [Streptomyces sp. NPDC058067]|uniref:hypothetical protein n=1 Tax=Streptomyces sp. NPDC058067 TaxID=3346324 RepID=UPI0036EC8804